LIRVAGLDYCVRLSTNANDFSSGDLNGEVDYNDCCITIRSDLNLKKQQQTFIHELTHIIVEGEESKTESENEQFVTRVSNILWGILADNQMLSDKWWESIVDEHPAWLSLQPATSTRGRPRRVNTKKRKR
jgi:hypothetical protein